MPTGIHVGISNDREGPELGVIKQEEDCFGLVGRAAIYLRISDDREGRELGVTRQEEDCLGRVRRKRWTLAGMYQDNDIGASTRSSKPRPQYDRMIADARNGKFDVIVAYTSSRLTRRPREHEDLIELAERHGIRFEYLRSPSFDLNTANGRMIARVLAAKDANEAEEISERVQREARQRAERGLPPGGTRLYGYDGMAIVEAEAERVRAAFRALLAGRTVTSIAEELGRTRAETRRLLVNARYAGLRVLRGKEYPGNWPKIVDIETWRVACAVLADPKRRIKVPSTARRWLGVNLYRCGRCGALMHCSYRTKSTGERSRTYLCHGCGMSRTAQPVDDYVCDAVIARLNRPDVRAAFAQPTPDVAPLREQVAALRARRQGLAAAWVATGEPPEALVEADRLLGAQIADLDLRLAAHLAPSVLDDVPEHLDEAGWRALGLERQRLFLDMLATVTLLPVPRGRVGFDPTRVEIIPRQP